MSISYLTSEDIWELNRDLRTLIATNGTLTRILEVISNDEIVVQLIKQQIYPASAKIPEFKDLATSRVLRRRVLLSGRKSGRRFIAAESLIAIDLLPSATIEGLTETDHPIGELILANRLETFKEEPEIWHAEFPNWVSLADDQDTESSALARRYRIIFRGQPTFIITEYFLHDSFKPVCPNGLQK
jgi:chorismate-pyruvate lyase